MTSRNGVPMLLAALLCAGCGAASEARPAGAEAAPLAAREAPSRAPTGADAWNRTARLLAGIPTGDPEAAPIEALASWQAHRADLDAGFDAIEARQLAPMRRWSAEELSGRVPREADVLYPFSGPDAVHVWAALPGRERYWLLSLEPVGTAPDLAQLDAAALEALLAGVRTSLESLLRWSFFQTRALRADLKQPGLEGVLPLVLLFAARDGLVVESVHHLSVGPDGRVEEQVARLGGAPPAGDDGVAGVRVRLRRGDDGAPLELVYFGVDLSSASLEARRAFFDELASHGPFAVYLKAASYLMFKPKYAAIRDYLLRHADAILQDDSGIPWSFLAARPWETRLYGRYDEPVSLFQHRRQEDLAEAYRLRDDVRPLPFTAGYRTRKGESNLILATRTAADR